MDGLIDSREDMSGSVRGCGFVAHVMNGHGIAKLSAQLGLENEGCSRGLGRE